LQSQENTTQKHLKHNDSIKIVSRKQKLKYNAAIVNNYINKILLLIKIPAAFHSEF